MLGSSRTYSTPTKLAPICVANLILWDSPPDRVPALLLKVRYSNPTSRRNFTLPLISFTICSAMNFFLSSRVKPDIKLYNSVIGKSVTSIMF